ncbi:MAG: 2-C-methyl-D-erythritol 4-phosphate cytidylyltransferase [Phycisphaerales bacterium]|nr:2-C-methyl-D-erythritol 4-phosphate cytidylyltransferase [Phycisphaerales bacterium]
MRLSVIIPAAGSSLRYGEQDKLAQDLGGRPVLVRTVELFAKHPHVMEIVVAGPPERLDAFRDRFGPTLGFHGARIVEGARAARWETVRKALAHVGAEATHVAVHDAARPALSVTMLDRVLDAAGRYDAVIPVVDLTSTVKRVDAAAEVVEEDASIADSIFGEVGRRSYEARAVVETIPRDGLVVVQTPQVFSVALLRRAYDAATSGVEATDDATLVERLGETVMTVPGEATNIKITTPDDLRLVRAVLGIATESPRPAGHRF